jgi:hypothetical protein
MTKPSFAYFSLALALAASPSLLAAPVAAGPGADPAASREAALLLTDLREEAAHVQSDAAQLQLWSLSSQLAWESHSQQLAEIRDNVNAMGRKLARLEQIRDMAAPWERMAIDRAAPLLKQVAVDTQKAILFVNDNREHLFAPDYHQMVSSLYDETRKLHQQVRDYQRLSRTQKREMQLEETLGMKAGS